jgi:transposase
MPSNSTTTCSPTFTRSRWSTRRTGRITKAGRRDIRAVMVEAAHAAVRSHAHWREEMARLEPRRGKNKAFVAIARKLVVTVWHVLTAGGTDRFADAEHVARKLLRHAYHLGRAHRPQGQSPTQYLCHQLDRLGLGAELTFICWGKRRHIALPPSQLSQEAP